MAARLFTAIFMVLALLAPGCGPDAEEVSSSATAVRVASFDFAESELLAEIYAQALEAGGLNVERLGVVGPREVVAPALEMGLIDVVPEYLGTVSAHFASAESDDGAIETALAARGLMLLEPAEAEDVNVFVVTRQLAEQYDLGTISDLARLPAERSLGGPVECPERPLCLRGLESRYGLTFSEFVPISSLDVTAEALVRGEVDVALMFSTSAQLSPDTFVALLDDQGLQPAENVVPLVRQDTLERWGPTLAATLDEVSRALTTEALQGMNRQVDQGQPATQVAAEWLENMNLPPG